MTRDFMQSAVYAEWAALGIVVCAQADGTLDKILERAKQGEGECRIEDLQQAAMNATLLNDDEKVKIAFFVTSARERARFLANQGKRSGKA